MIYDGGVRRWWPAALLVGLGAIAGFLYAQVAQPTYVTSAYVAAVARDAGDNAAAVSYAGVYARIARQGDVISAAVKASGGGASADELRRQVTTTTSPEGPVIEVTGAGDSPQRAAEVANLVAAGVISTAGRNSDETRVDLVLLSPAVPPTQPASPRPVLDVAVGASVGLLLGGLLVLTRGRRSSTDPPVDRVSPTATPGARPAGSGNGHVPAPAANAMAHAAARDDEQRALSGRQPRSPGAGEAVDE